jgi:hypothetical protein
MSEVLQNYTKNIVKIRQYVPVKLRSVGVGGGYY